MIRQLFERKAGYEATVLAEAQSLRDDGLDLDFVLGLFPDDAEWLEPLLLTTTEVDQAFDAEPPSYYFEASLKARFLGAAREPQPVIPVVVSPPTFSPFRTGIATGSVAAAAAGLGILALGFVTAGDSSPGDWNYSFKLANERFQYSTSRGDSRLDIQIRTVQARIAELNAAGANANESQFAAVRREYDELTDQLAKRDEIDNVRFAQIVGMSGTAAAVISDVAAKQPAFAEQAAAASEAISNTVQVAGGIATGLPSPTPTATPVLSPTAEPTTSVTPSPSPEPTEAATVTPEATPKPAGSATPEPSVTGTVQPIESATTPPSSTTTP